MPFWLLVFLLQGKKNIFYETYRESCNRRLLWKCKIMMPFITFDIRAEKNWMNENFVPWNTLELRRKRGHVTFVLFIFCKKKEIIFFIEFIWDKLPFSYGLLLFKRFGEGVRWKLSGQDNIEHHNIKVISIRSHGRLNKWIRNSFLFFVLV